MPAAAAEALTSNLLLNAIQHGSAGVIGVTVDEQTLVVVNPYVADDRQPGHGLGLELGRRITTHIGLTLSTATADGQHVVRVAPAPGDGNSAAQAPALARTGSTLARSLRSA
jgi:hypothetical protein